MSQYLSVRDLDVAGKRVFLRLDLNVPIKGGLIKDDSRIKAALPTLNHLLDRGAAVIACSHLGRPKGKVLPEVSLAPVAARIRELLPGREVLFAQDVVGPDASAKLSSLKPGQVLLLENVRFEPGETKDDPVLAAKFRAMADLYVNDAFGTVHRAHASVSAAAKLFPSAATGFLLERELDYLVGKLGNPEHPYTAFLGGAKVSDKIPVIRRLVDRVDTFCVGGAMAFTFISAEGRPTGTSLTEPDLRDTCREILSQAWEKGVRFLLPSDHRAARSLEEGEAVSVIATDAFPEGLAGYDIGPETARVFSAEAARSRTIFWNGPMGVFEKPAFSEGTMALARAVAESGAVTIIGGGDSVAAVNQAGVADKISHISTGGGASLELLAGESLPGVEVLTKR